MPSVRDILEKKKGQPVITIAADAHVLDAAKLMNQHHIGALVVADGRKVIGIFSERDVLNRVVARELSPGQTIVRSVMTTPVAVCSPATTRAECRAVMRHRRIRHLPVVDNDELVGIVSIGEIMADSEADKDDTIRYLYEYMIGEWK